MAGILLGAVLLFRQTEKLPMRSWPTLLLLANILKRQGWLPLLMIVQKNSVKFNLGIAFSLICFLVTFPVSGWAQIKEENSCIVCHSDIAEETKDSIHSQNGITCQNCHGGDATKADKESAKAPGTGYIGIPDKKQLVGICGECHANVEVMNFYGIRTDQLAQYKTSLHGKKLLQESDTHVAACSDCHGYHDVLAVTDPNSPVYPLNIPKTCNKCHGNEKLMSKYNIPSDEYNIYKDSVHGQALYEKKDLSVATCVSCHGSHGALPPGVKEIGNTCGKCHINEKKYFLESVHAKLQQEGKFTSECITCHGNHGVTHPSVALYEQACVKCHDVQSEEYQQGHQISQMLKDSQEKLSSMEALIKESSIEGFYVEEESSALEQIKTHVIEMAPLQHTLSKDRIAQHHDKITEIANDIKDKIQRKRQNLIWRKLALIPIWLFIFIMVSALKAKYKQLKQKKDEVERKNE